MFEHFISFGDVTDAELKGRIASLKDRLNMWSNIDS
jgi:hypothetical protein